MKNKLKTLLKRRGQKEKNKTKDFLLLQVRKETNASLRYQTPAFRPNGRKYIWNYQPMWKWTFYLYLQWQSGGGVVVFFLYLAMQLQQAQPQQWPPWSIWFCGTNRCPQGKLTVLRLFQAKFLYLHTLPASPGEMLNWFQKYQSRS